jgi:hypothetical protein
MIEEVNSSMMYLIHCKKLCKCHNTPQPNIAIKEEVIKLISSKKRKKESTGRLSFQHRPPIKLQYILK